jgi:hypothetical protein
MKSHFVLFGFVLLVCALETESAPMALKLLGQGLVDEFGARWLVKNEN